MPIHRDLFANELDDVDDQIIGLLRSSPNEAFSLDELASHVGMRIETLEDEASFIQRLAEVEYRGFIVAKPIHGAWYYSVAS